MTNNIDVAKAAQLLSEKNNILLLCHKNPDGDTIGAAAGLCHALKIKGKKVAVLCSDEFPANYSFMQVPLYHGQFDVHFTVAVDVASFQLLGDKIDKYIQNIDLCIDHHGSNSGYAKMLCCYPDRAATAQLVLEIIEEMGCEINQLVANCLYTGIITDSGCFKYSSTTPQTHLAAAKLMQAGAETVKLVDIFFMSKTKKNIALQKYLLNNLEFTFDDKCALIALTSKILEEVQPSPTDIEGISAMPRTIEGVEVAITLKQIGEDVFKISIRTGENVDACSIAQGLGGGGHIRAAGCEVMGNLESVKKAILKEVEHALCK